MERPVFFPAVETNNEELEKVENERYGTTSEKLINRLRELSKVREEKRQASLDEALEAHMRVQDYFWLLNTEEKTKYLNAMQTTTNSLDAVLEYKSLISKKLKDHRCKIQPFLSSSDSSDSSGSLFIKREYQQEFCKFIQNCENISSSESMKIISTFLDRSDLKYTNLSKSLLYQRQSINENQSSLGYSHELLEEVKQLKNRLLTANKATKNTKPFNKENDSCKINVAVNKVQLPWIPKFP